MRHALTHLREELRRLKAVQMQIQSEKYRRSVTAWAIDARQNLVEQFETTQAIILILEARAAQGDSA